MLVNPTRLNVYNRPYEAYDPNKKEHRKALAEFVKTGSWAKCPVQFVHTDQTGEHLPVMFARTLAYYAQKEFAS